MSRQEHAECSFMLTVICYIQFLMLLKREGTVEMYFFEKPEDILHAVAVSCINVKCFLMC